ncbi:MAG: hypothetical protein Q9157_008824, partial [Trypethelium eluteriae]
MATLQTALAEPKMSRYRSVRKAAQQSNLPRPIPQEPVPSTAISDTIIRSRSRYHRPKTAGTEPTPDFISNPTQQFGTTTLIVGNAELPNTSRPRDASNSTIEAREKARKAVAAREVERQQRLRDEARPGKDSRQYAEKALRVKELELDQPDQTELALRQNEERKIRAQRRQDAAIAKHQLSRPSTAKERTGPPASNFGSEPKANVAIRSQGNRNIHPAPVEQPNQQSEYPRKLQRQPSGENTSPKGIFGFLKRRKPSDLSKLPSASTTSALSKISEPKSENVKADISKAENIAPGGGGVVPGTDAPRTAINAGERRVLVECNQSSIQLPVTPDTTPSDLIYSAANCLSEPINPKASVLLESFSKVGVQRRLRMYEHVRDVMNSWDSDSQNTLLLVESASGGVDQDLTTANVPSQQPSGGSFAMYYSQKPGKWDKRWVTVTEDGQIVLAKIGSSKKDTTNVCHLSDFDIYTPTKKQMSKKVKPPKKHCFAVKSQQKSGIFMSTTNFVHFFATGDRDTGAEFYRAIHGWRCWYLVNVMGEGKRARKESNPQKPATDAQTNTQIPTAGRRMSVSGEQSHNRRVSEDTHYPIGSMKPLIDPASLDPKLDANAPLPQSFHERRRSHDIQASSETKAAYQRNMSMRNRSKPPVSFPKKLQKEDANRPTTAHATPQQPSTTPSDDSAFAPSSLLGRTYSQRQAQQREREAQQTSPFTAGPSLVNGGLDDPPPPSAGLKRSSSGRQPPTPSTPADLADRTNSLARGNSKRIPTKPLVDLTPTYREPPQHARKGRGFHPEQVGPGGLVENATSPEEAIQIPSAVDWRSGRRGSVSGGAAGGGNGMRSEAGGSWA